MTDSQISGVNQAGGRSMKIIRIVLVVANGGWLLILLVGLVLAEMKWSLLQAIPVVVFSLIMAGNVAYIWRFPPR